MKFTLSWLKYHLETTASLDEIVNTLTMIGLEVEHVDDPLTRLAPFKTVCVEKIEPHPNADRLQICHVNTGNKSIQVVCGAPNARSGMIAVFAPTGVIIPATGILLIKSVIRGIESNGMLLSEREIGLSNEHGKIIELPDNTPIGEPFAKVAGMNDPMIDIAITPNRADCLGVYGIARDLAGAGIGNLKKQTISPIASSGNTCVGVTINLGDQAHLCPAFAIRSVKGVKNSIETPNWIRQRLQAIGLRSINILVDIINFATFDQNHPLHVFDADKVVGNLTVRMAKNDEKIKTLDGNTYTLQNDMIVIDDEKGILSIAGIMGGERAVCDKTTTNILLEAALWNPVSIARTGRKLGIHSDAKHRFERGVDAACMLSSAEMATKIILNLCGGNAAKIVMEGKITKNGQVLSFDPYQVERLSGIKIQVEKICDILTKLGFQVKHSGKTEKLEVSVPSWRMDVQGQADLVEEVIRIAGVNKITAVKLPALKGVQIPDTQIREQKARRILAARGMIEAITWPFIASKHAKIFGGGEQNVELVNPIANDMSHMRPNLLPGLISATQRNVDRGITEMAIFEVGNIYQGNKPKEQIMVAAGIRRGISHLTGAGRHWLEKETPANTFDVKADVIATLEAIGTPVNSLQTVNNAPSWFHPGRSGSLQLGPGKVLAHFGEIHPEVYQCLDISGVMAGFEIFFEEIPTPRRKKIKSPCQLYHLQPVRRDFAFIVNKNVKADDIIRAAKNADKILIADVRLFDLFENSSLGKDKISCAIEVTLQPKDKTLTDDKIEEISQKIVSMVEKETKGVLRKENFL